MRITTFVHQTLTHQVALLRDTLRPHLSWRKAKLSKDPVHFLVQSVPSYIQWDETGDDAQKLKAREALSRICEGSGNGYLQLHRDKQEMSN